MKKIISMLAGLLAMAPAWAMAEQVSTECTWEGSASCEATCQPTASYFTCDVDPPECSAKIPTECSAELQVSATCSADCQASCEAECTAKPATFSCSASCQAKLEAECTAKIDANCSSRCSAEADKATCESSCKSELQASCKGSGSATCDTQCQGTKGSVDCKSSCTSSCKGSCDANAQARATCDGYLKCQSTGKIACQTDFKANCTGSCQTKGGALVCNGQVVTFGALADAKAWIESHGYARGSSSSSCTGNTCEAQAEGEAGVSCSASSVPVSSGTTSAVGLLAFAYGASRLRRRRLARRRRLGYTSATMPDRRRALLLALGLVASSGLVLASRRLASPREIAWHHGEAEGRLLATRERRPVVLDFTASWCVACQELAQKTLSDRRVIDEAQGFVAIQVDASDEADPSVEATLARYRVSGLPTLVFLDAQGNEKARLVNLVDPPAVIDALRKAR